MAITALRHRNVLSIVALAFCFAFAASPLVALATPTPGSPGSGAGAGRPGVTNREMPGEQFAHPAPTAATLCNNASPASLQYDQFMDPMGQSTGYAFNTFGAGYTRGPTLMSLYGYGTSNLLSWWNYQDPNGLAFNPIANPCSSAPGFLDP
jgi:hypothetical protein